MIMVSSRVALVGGTWRNCDRETHTPHIRTPVLIRSPGTGGCSKTFLFGSPSRAKKKHKQFFKEDLVLLRIHPSIRTKANDEKVLIKATVGRDRQKNVISHLISLQFFSPALPLFVTEILGHIAGIPPLPTPDDSACLHFFSREWFSIFLPRRLALKCCGGGK